MPGSRESTVMLMFNNLYRRLSLRIISQYLTDHLNTTVGRTVVDKHILDIRIVLFEE
jgi:hypothetical protein